MDDTTTRLYETFEIAFQNNVSLTVANTGGLYRQESSCDHERPAPLVLFEA